MYDEQHEDAANFAPDTLTQQQRFTELAGLLAAALLRIPKGTQSTSPVPSEDGDPWQIAADAHG